MAFSFQNIRYGWVALAGLVITGTTIYVANNTRKHIEPVDIIEIVLGTHERCLATKWRSCYTNVYYWGYTSVYPDAYSVAPLSVVENWLKEGATPNGSVTSNYPTFGSGPFRICYTSYWPSMTPRVICYTNNLFTQGNIDNYWRVLLSVNYASSWTAEGGYVWTNIVNPAYLVFTEGDWAWHPYPSIVTPLTITDSYEQVTNAIGWHVSREMLKGLDATIKALVPQYVDESNTVYLGSNHSIVMLTVTGLWASLGIGDKTNKFTREPCWTNLPITNYSVCYTQDTSTLTYDHYTVEDITTNGILYYTIHYFYTTNLSSVVQSYTSSVPQEVNYVYGHYGEEYLAYHYVGTNYDYKYWYSRMIYQYTNVVFSDGQVVITTNMATYRNDAYGDTTDYPWQIYPEDLQERYKVLQSLKVLSKGYNLISETKTTGWGDLGYYGSEEETHSSDWPYWYHDGQNSCLAQWPTAPWVTNAVAVYRVSYDLGGGSSPGASAVRTKSKISLGGGSRSCGIPLDSHLYVYLYAGGANGTNDMDSTGKNGWFLFGDNVLAQNNIGEVSVMVNDTDPMTYSPAHNVPDSYLGQHGRFGYSDPLLILTPTFNYCTVKYW